MSAATVEAVATWSAPTTAAEHSPGPHWVARSVERAMRTTQIGSVAAAQLAFIGAALASDVRGSRLLLTGLHSSLALLGVGVLRGHAHPTVFMAALYALLVTDLATAVTVDEPLVAVAFIGASTTVLMPVALRRGVGPVLASVAVWAAICAAVELLQPQWDRHLTTALAVSVPSMMIGAVVLMRDLRGFAARTDCMQAESEAEARRAVGARAAADAATESARVLHDTVINTLGAVANGHAGAAPDVVRARCRHDVRRVESLWRPDAARGAPGWLFDPDAPEPYGIERFGLRADALRRYAALVPPEVARALHGCAHEAVTNATKHAAAARITVDVQRRGQDLVVQVADDGVGFDCHAVPRRGLDESVWARAAEHGIRVELATSPGCGTRVVLRYGLAAAPAVVRPAPVPAMDVVRQTRRRACWVWCALMVLPGLAAETINRRGELTPAHLMLVIGGAGALLAWCWCRRGGDLPEGVAVVLAWAAPAVLLLALAAVEFGRSYSYLFQAAGVTPLLVVLSVAAPTSRALRLAAGLTAVAVVVALLVVAEENPSTAAMTGILIAPVVVLLVAWTIFHRQMGVIGLRFAELRQQAVDARFGRAAVAFGDVARSRWQAAGIQGAVGLLRGVADGTLDPRDPHVRRRCGDEERYLRQITGLRPDGALMAWWLAFALVEARARDVRLRVQPGALDLGDVRAAEAFGELVLACLARVPAGSELVVTLLEHGGCPRLFVVGPSRTFDRSELPPVDGCEVTRCELVGQTLVEATWRVGTE